MKIFGLCQGRHEMPTDIQDYIFPMSVNPTNLSLLDETVKEKLKTETAIKLYVTGLTVALTAVLKFCFQNGIKVTLLHYNRETKTYYEQEVIV